MNSIEKLQIQGADHVVEIKLGPRDKLILVVDEHLDDKVALDIRKKFEDALAGDKPLVLGKGLTLSILHQD